MLYRIAKIIFAVYFFFVNKVTVQGQENIPANGGLILCSNHMHWMDPILMGVYIKRKICFMAKVELFKKKIFAMILKGIHAFPVKRGTADITAIKNSFKALKNGQVLGMFPEGTRSKDGSILPAEPGVALISTKADVPVVPMRINGSYKFSGRLYITIGKPIYFKEYKDKKLSTEEMSKLSQIVMDEISRLA